MAAKSEGKIKEGAFERTIWNKTHPSLLFISSSFSPLWDPFSSWVTSRFGSERNLRD